MKALVLQVALLALWGTRLGANRVLVVSSMQAQYPRVRPAPRVSPADTLELLSRMSPEQRARALAGLPPGQQRQLANGLRRLERLNPEEREQWLLRYRRFQQLTPLQKQAVRNMVFEFRSLPQPRRAAVKRELDALKRMPETERIRHLESEEFRSRFTPQERNIILLAAPVLPDF